MVLISLFNWIVLSMQGNLAHQKDHHFSTSLVVQERWYENRDRIPYVSRLGAHDATFFSNDSYRRPNLDNGHRLYLEIGIVRIVLWE